MRFLAFLAMANVGFDCVQRATGDMPQTIFSDDVLWLWWLSAIAWFLCGSVVLVRGAK